MKFGIIGLGRIGGNLSLHAMGKGHEVVGHSKSIEELKSLELQGLEPAESIENLILKLDSPRIVFLYIPHGNPVEEVCAEIKNIWNLEILLLMVEIRIGRNLLVDTRNSRNKMFTFWIVEQVVE